MTSNAAEELAIAIGLAISGGHGHPYDAKSTCQHGNLVEHFAITVHPNAMRWSSASLKTGRTQSFDPQTLTLHDGEEARHLSLDRIPGSFAEQVQLAFPLSLPIWGRQRDEYHPVAVEQHKRQTILILRHREDNGIFGSLVVDRDTGVATRLVTPTRALLQEVQQMSTSTDGAVSFGFVTGSEPQEHGRKHDIPDSPR